jgi:uncharacterized protein (TIGR00730 family)
MGRIATGTRRGDGAVRRIAVFCGASQGARPEYAEAAAAFGRAIARRGIELVYGGSSIGTMGVLASATLAAGGHVIGVVPRLLVEREIAYAGLPDLRTVETLSERKALMADLADAFVALPGGFGTLDELFEMVTWGQLGLQTKPCGLLNVSGYYDGLLAFLEHASAERFVRREHLAALLRDPSPEGLLAQLTAARAA